MRNSYSIFRYKNLSLATIALSLAERARWVAAVVGTNVLVASVLIASVLIASMLIANASWAQDQALEISDPPLIDQQPFDLITLKATAGGGSFKVAPLPFPNRQLPPRPAVTEKLENLILLKAGDSRRYEISWKDIETIGVGDQILSRDENDPDFAATTGGGKGYSSGFPGGLPLPSVGCPGIVSGSPQDPIALQVSVRVPDNAVGFSFDSNFYVRDWPQFVCSTFDDAFFAFVSPTPAGLLDGHVTFYGNGNPISLNGAPFDVCACKAPPCMAGGQTYACTQGNAALAGTGFTTNAATGWQTTTVSTVPGSEITLRLGVYDAGDGAFTATALVDAFTWSTTGVTVQTVATP